MLTIKVWCLPKLSQKKLNRLFVEIVQVVQSIGPLVKAGYTGEGTILVLFPIDAMKMGLGSEVLVEVDGLRTKDKCNFETRNELAEKLGNLVQKHVPDAQIDCRVRNPVGDVGIWMGARRGISTKRNRP